MKRMITAIEAEQNYPGFVRSMAHARVLVDHLQNPSGTSYVALHTLLTEGFRFENAPQGLRYWNSVIDALDRERPNQPFGFGGVNPAIFDVVNTRNGNVIHWREDILDMFLVDEYDFKEFEKDDDDDF